MVSPPKTFTDMVTNSNGKLDPETYDRLKGTDKIHSTGQNFYRSSSPKNSKFYEKSLSFKSKSKNKLQNIKCLNHDHSLEEECDH